MQTVELEQFIDMNPHDIELLRGYRRFFREIHEPNSHIHTSAYYAEISKAPDHLRIGMLALIAESLGDPGNHAPESSLKEILYSTNPAQLRRTRDRDTCYSYAAQSAVIGMLILNSKALMQYLPSIHPVRVLGETLGCLKGQEGLILLREMYDAASDASSVDMTSQVFLAPKHTGLLNRVSGLETARHTPDALGLAVAARGLALPIRGVEATKYGNEYLDRFMEYFQGQPVLGISLIAEAMRNGFSKVSRVLANLAVGNEGWTVAINGNSLQEMRSFLPLFKAVVEEAKSEMGQGIEGRATVALKSLVHASFAPIREKDGEYSQIRLVFAAGRSEGLSDQEKITLGKVVTLCFKDFGYILDLKTDEEVLDIIFGDYEISADKVTRGHPVYAKLNGEVRVIGHFEKIRPVANEQKRISQATPEPQAAETAPVERVLSIQEELSELLRGIFPNELTDLEIEDLWNEAEFLWMDLDPNSPELKRRKSLSPLASRLRLVAGKAAAANENFLPRVEYRKIQETDRSSDIGGVILLGGGKSLPFFIDKAGGLQCQILDFANRDEMPFDLYWQLNHRVLSIIHEVLVGSAEEQRARARDAMARAEVSIMDGTGIKRVASLKKLANLVAESKAYLRQETRTDGSGRVVTVYIVDRDKVISELSPGGSKSVVQDMSEDDLMEASRRKGSARPHAVMGSLVLLPYGFSPRRVAIENAKRNHVPLIKMTTIYMDADGLTTEIVIRTTYRSDSVYSQSELVLNHIKRYSKRSIIESTEI